MQREIEGLQKTLAARSAELDAEKDTVLRLRRERAPVDSVATADEAAARQSAAYRAQAAEVTRLGELAAAREAEVTRLQQSVAALGPQAQHAAVLDQAAARLRAQLEEHGQRIADLEARLRAAEDQRDRLEQQVCLRHSGSRLAISCGHLRKVTLRRMRCNTDMMLLLVRNSVWPSISLGHDAPEPRLASSCAQADADAAARGDQRTVAQLQLQLREVSTRAAAAQRQAARKADLAARQEALSTEAAAARTELQVMHHYHLDTHHFESLHEARVSCHTGPSYAGCARDAGAQASTASLA